MMFVQLHGHSHYSLLEALGTPTALVAQAKKLGMTALGLTDYNGMYGVIDFYQACKKADIQPLIGVEIGIVQDRMDKTTKELPGTITLLAKNHQGYLDLLDIISHAHLEGFHIIPRIDWALLQAKAKNLIGWMGGRHAVLGKMVLEQESEKKIEETIGMFRDFFNNGDFYLELIAQDEKREKDLAQINNIAKKLSVLLSCELFCNTNYHYIHQDDKEAYEVAMAIKDGKRIYDEDKRKAHGERRLMSETQVKDIMHHNGYTPEEIDSMIACTGSMAKKVDLDIPLDTILFPQYDSDPTIQATYEQVKDGLIEIS